MRRNILAALSDDQLVFNLIAALGDDPPLWRTAVLRADGHLITGSGYAAHDTHSNGAVFTPEGRAEHERIVGRSSDIWERNTARACERFREAAGRLETFTCLTATWLGSGRVDISFGQWFPFGTTRSTLLNFVTRDDWHYGVYRLADDDIYYPIEDETVAEASARELEAVMAETRANDSLECAAL